MSKAREENLKFMYTDENNDKKKTNLHHPPSTLFTVSLIAEKLLGL